VGDPIHLGLRGHQGVLLRGTDVDVKDAPLGDDVRPGPALDHAGVDRDAGPTAVQLVQRDDLVRGLQDRASPSLGLHAGMGCPPEDLDPELRPPLAGRDDVPALPRALQDERGVRVGGRLLDVRAGEGRADLLVRVADVREGPEPAHPGLTQHLHGEEPGEQAPLHVGDAGAGRTVALDPEGTLGRRSRFEDGVGMADHQDARTAPTVEPPDHEVPELRLHSGGDVADPLHLPSACLEPRPALVGDLVCAPLVERPAIDVHHSPEILDEFVVPASGDPLEFLDVHGPKYRSGSALALFPALTPSWDLEPFSFHGPQEVMIGDMEGRRRVAALIVLLAAPLAGLLILLLQPDYDVTWEHHPAHFWLVLSTASICVTLGLAIGVVADRRGDPRLAVASLPRLPRAGVFGLEPSATAGG